MKRILTKSVPLPAAAASALLFAAVILPGRLPAQEPGPAEPGRPAQVNPGPAPGPADAQPRFRNRPVPGGTAIPGIAPSPGAPAPNARLPLDVAPARFEAAVYELRVAEDQLASLDAQSLENKAASAQSLAQALSRLGQTRILYKVDQTVNLYGENILLGSSEPMVTGTRALESGKFVNSITYQQVGLRISIVSVLLPPNENHKGMETQLSLQLSVLADSGVELAPDLKASRIRNVDLSHSENPRFGRPSVQLSVWPASGTNAAMAYVVRYVFSEVKP